MKPPKTNEGVRKVPIVDTLMPLIERLKKRGGASALALPCLDSFNENHLAELWREHLALAGLDRKSDGQIADIGE